MEYLVYFNALFWALQWNVLGTSMQCVGHSNGMFGAPEWKACNTFDRICGALQCNIWCT